MRPNQFMKAASLARLSAADAFLLDNACPDIVSVLVFDIDGESPSFDTIRDQILRNIERMDAFPVRLAHDRLKAGFPYRVRSRRWSDSAMVELRSSTTWDGALAELSDLVGCKVDPFTQCVKVHVFRNVESAPTVSGTATLVALQVNHAIADGRGAAGILQELLGGGGSSSARARPLDRDIRPGCMQRWQSSVYQVGSRGRTGDCFVCLGKRRTTHEIIAPSSRRTHEQATGRAVSTQSCSIGRTSSRSR